MNQYIDRITLVIFALIFLILTLIGALIFTMYTNINPAFFILSIGFILIFSWGIISIDLKNKKGIDFIIGIALMIFLEVLTISLLFLIVIKFDIKWPERGGSFLCSYFFLSYRHA